LEIEPSNAQAKAGLESVNRAVKAEAEADGMRGDPMGGLGNIFNDPQLIQKLASNPKTASLLADREFMAKLQQMKSNPQMMGAALQDPWVYSWA